MYFMDNIINFKFLEFFKCIMWIDFFFKYIDNGFKKKEINENVILNYIFIYIL